MKIKIEVKNGILGNSVFWIGDSYNIDEIPNIAARYAAAKLITQSIDYRFNSFKYGMWIATII